MNKEYERYIEPKTKGGSDRVSKLCLSCEKCNQKKGLFKNVQGNAV